jgi:hypothetical protein
MAELLHSHFEPKNFEGEVLSLENFLGLLHSSSFSLPAPEYVTQ